MILDGEPYVSYFAPCWHCKHKSKPFDGTCKAFANEIPTTILEGKNKHTEKHRNQINEIVFEPIKDK